jgi:hypothetical protein
MKPLALLLAALPTIAMAQTPLKPRATPIPAAVRAWVAELAGICTSSGGRPGRSPALIKYADLTGDGLQDFIVDAGSFNCEGAASAMSNGQSGADLSIFAAGPGNTATKAFSGSVYSNEIDTKGKVPRLYIEVSGVACGQRNAARLPFSQVTSCMRPLNWVAARRVFVLAPMAEKRGVSGG